MALAFVDQTLVCVDCHQPFVFSVAEQAFYAERGCRQPVRCPDCRAKRRAERNAEAIRAIESLSHTAEPLTGSGGFCSSMLAGGRGRRNGKAAGPRFAYPAICTACGRQTEVPFSPRNGRPVFCRECFDLRRGR